MFTNYDVVQAARKSEREAMKSDIKRIMNWCLFGGIAIGFVIGHFWR